MIKKLCLLSLTLVAVANLNAQIVNCNPEPTSRVRITNANLPNAFTCFMEMTRGSSPRYGTGFLIHPRVILTAGHNLAWFGTGHVNQIKAYFGSIDSENYLASDTLNLTTDKNKFFQAAYWFKHSIYQDYSIVILPDSSIYKKVGGYYKIANSSDYNKIDSLCITGSPGDKYLFEMWTSATKSFNIEPNKGTIKYDLYTVERNSGSPIWAKIKNEYYVFGVHSRGWGKCGAAVLLDEDVVEQLKKWCKSAGIEL